MRLRCLWRSAAVLGLVLAAAGNAAWAQQPEQPQLALTGRLVFGFADFAQGAFSRGGPALTLESDLSGYWRDPRILQFEFRPMITVGEAVPGTEIGNALTGFIGVATILQGSSFPLRLSYSRTGSSFEESGVPGGSLLSGVQIGTTNSVFDADWMLRFKHLPTIHLDYRDTNFSSDLPAQFAATDTRAVRNFTAHVNYSGGGWQAGGWYRRTQSTVTTPNLFAGGIQRDDNNTSDVGFNASKLLPFHSSLGVSGDRSESQFKFDGLETDTTVTNANATLTSNPVQRLSMTLQAQYTSNLQGYQELLALAGAGVPGIGSGTSGTPAPAVPVPFNFLAAPYKVMTFSGGIGLQLGHGFSVTGSGGESHSSNSGSATRWSVGLGYHRQWQSGWLSASYSRSSVATEAEVLTPTPTGGGGVPVYTFFSEELGANTAAVNLNQNLPRQFRLMASAHVSDGTLTDNGVPFPNHAYGGLASVTRPVGEWTLTGSVNVEKNDMSHSLIYNESTAKGIAFGAAYRGLSLTASRQYGSGLAVQLGESLVFVSNPGAVSPLLGVPVLSSTTGTTLTGSYRSRRNRLLVTGDWGRFNYTTYLQPVTQYSLLSLRASYALRRLRLIGGFVRQSQVFNTGPSGLYQTRLVYFQVERVFRVF